MHAHFCPRQGLCLQLHLLVQDINHGGLIPRHVNMARGPLGWPPPPTPAAVRPSTSTVGGRVVCLQLFFHTVLPPAAHHTAVPHRDLQTSKKGNPTYSSAPRHRLRGQQGGGGVSSSWQAKEERRQRDLQLLPLPLLLLLHLSLSLLAAPPPPSSNHNTVGYSLVEDPFSAR